MLDTAPMSEAELREYVRGLITDGTELAAHMFETLAKAKPDALVIAPAQQARTLELIRTAEVTWPDQPQAAVLGWMVLRGNEDGDLVAWDPHVHTHDDAWRVHALAVEAGARHVQVVAVCQADIEEMPHA